MTFIRDPIRRISFPFCDSDTETAMAKNRGMMAQRVTEKLASPDFSRGVFKKRGTQARGVDQPAG
jgi:hypothetical protein